MKNWSETFVSCIQPENIFMLKYILFVIFYICIIIMPIFQSSDKSRLKVFFLKILQVPLFIKI